MHSVLTSESSGHVVFLCKRYNSASVYTVFNWVLANLMLGEGGNPVLDRHPIQGGVEILLATPC